MYRSVKKKITEYVMINQLSTIQKLTSKKQLKPSKNSLIETKVRVFIITGGSA